MNIVFLTAEYPPQPGGVGDYTRCLAQALAAGGATVSVLATGTALLPADCYAPQDVTDGNGNTHAPFVWPVISSWKWCCWRDIIAALDLLYPDILHIQYQTGAYGMHPAINLLPWRLRGLSSRPRVVVTFHDLLEPYLFPKAGRLRRWITMRLAQDADDNIVTNSEDAAQLQGIVKPTIIPIGSNIAVAPPEGYLREQWRLQLGVSSDEFVIAYFGLLSRSKGIDVLLDALKLLNHTDASTRYRLLLIGGAATAPQDSTYAAEIEQRIAAQERYIIRTGHVDEAAVSAHLLAADCVALPFRAGASFRSGSLLAALSHGRAVITTGTTSSPISADGESLEHRNVSSSSHLPSSPGPFSLGEKGRSEDPLPQDSDGKVRPTPGSAGGSPAPGRGLAVPNPYLITNPAFTIRVPQGEGFGGRSLPGEETATSAHMQPPLAPPQLVHGDNVWLVPPESPTALAEAVQRLAQDESLRTRLGTGAQQLAAHFGWEEIAQRHREVYGFHSFQDKPQMNTNEHR